MAEGPLSKSDSKQRRIDVAAVGNRKSPFAATLAGEPRTEVRPLEPEEQLPLFAIFRLSRTGRLARFARPQAYELPAMRACVCQSPGGRPVLPWSESGRSRQLRPCWQPASSQHRPQPHCYASKNLGNADSEGRGGGRLPSQKGKPPDHDIAWLFTSCEPQVLLVLSCLGQAADVLALHIHRHWQAWELGDTTQVKFLT